jgi:hypothetical protein
MVLIPLEPIVNQKFSTRLDNSRYEITIKETRGIMAVTILRDDVTIVDSVRAVAGVPLIPYAYLESGNFAFSTANDELPDWTKFGTTQNLIYAGSDELEIIRNA